MYAERVGEKIGNLVSEIIVDSLTLLWAERPSSQLPVVAREPSTSNNLLKGLEVAERLGISKAKAYQLMQRKEIPTVCMGRSVRVRQQDLEEFIKRQAK
jgi:excisionase family DNA binding protein